MLTKALSLLLVIFLGLALGLETARFVHAHAAGVGGVAGASSMVNIHRALLGFSLLATSGALLLSLRADSRGGAGAWLSHQWSRFTIWLELTLDGLFDFDALNVGDGTGPVVLRSDDAKRPKADGDLLPCRGCSWCGEDPGDLPDELWTECDGSGRYLPNTAAERQRQLAHPKLPLRQAAPRSPPD